MLVIEIENKEYSIPDSWEEMTLDYYCGIYGIIKKYQATEEEEKSDNDLSKYFFHQQNKMNKKLKQHNKRHGPAYGPAFFDK